MGIHEFRHAVRGLARTPGFTAVAVLTLGLALGANTAIFALVDAVLLSPLPYPSSERLVRITHPVPGQGLDAEWQLSQAGYFDLRERSRTLDDLGAFVRAELNLTTAEGAERIRSVAATANVLGILGSRPLHGRLFRPDEDTPGGPDVVILAHGLWLRHFGGDPAIVGQTVRLHGTPHEVIGVLPAGFDLADAGADVWVPLGLDPAAQPVNSHYLEAIGVRRAGVEVPQVQADLARVVDGFGERFPGAYSASFMSTSGFGVAVHDLREDVVGDFRAVLWILLGAVLLVLAIACANVINLFLVRTEGRSREVAVRTALGASRRQLASYFFVETLTMALLAAAAGVAIASAGLRLLVTVAPESLPRLDSVAIGAPSILFAAGLALLVGLVLGAFPVLRFAATAPSLELVGARGATPGRRRNAVQGALVVAQVALALVLLVSAGLLVGSFNRLRAVEPGFEPEGVLTFDVALPFASYRSDEAVGAFHLRMQERIAAIPGVASVAGVTDLPLLGAGSCVLQFTEAGAGRPGGTERAPCPPMQKVMPGYFSTMGIPLVAGREIELRDETLRNGSVVVSRALAERLWPGADPVGQRMAPFGWGEPWYTVVGVAENVRHEGLERPPAEVVYYPLLNIEGTPWIAPRLLTAVVRARSGDPTAVADPIRSAVAGLDRDVAVANVRTMGAVVDASTARASFAMVLLGIAAGLALVLGCVGLYGVVSYVVGQRRKEMGVRMALGARTGEVARLVLGRSLRLALGGILIGIVGALATTRVLASLLFEISATDPLTIAAVSILLLAIALLASWIPAREAARVQPMEVLRVE
jgi:predicted permease